MVHFSEERIECHHRFGQIVWHTILVFVTIVCVESCMCRQVRVCMTESSANILLENSMKKYYSSVLYILSFIFSYYLCDVISLTCKYYKIKCLTNKIYNIYLLDY
jgi:hypothetical protein